MRASFKPEGGALADPSQERGEQEATSALFAGAIGVFKNPSSHREVEYDDPTFASTPCSPAALASLAQRSVGP